MSIKKILQTWWGNWSVGNVPLSTRKASGPGSGGEVPNPQGRPHVKTCGRGTCPRRARLLALAALVPVLASCAYDFPEFAPPFHREVATWPPAEQPRGM